jgi:hypothetical protein
MLSIIIPSLVILWCEKKGTAIRKIAPKVVKSRIIENVRVPSFMTSRFLSPRTWRSQAVRPNPRFTKIILTTILLQVRNPPVVMGVLSRSQDITSNNQIMFFLFIEGNLALTICNSTTCYE